MHCCILLKINSSHHFVSSASAITLQMQELIATPLKCTTCSNKKKKKNTNYMHPQNKSCSKITAVACRNSITIVVKLTETISDQKPTLHISMKVEILKYTFTCVNQE